MNEQEGYALLNNVKVEVTVLELPLLLAKVTAGAPAGYRAWDKTTLRNG